MGTAFVPLRPPVIWMTCLDGHDHAIRDEHMAETSGVYETVCGVRVLPAASQDPPFPRCGSCLGLVAGWTRARRAVRGPARWSRRGRVTG